MQYRNGVENPRNIIRVHDDGREEPIATVYDPEDAVEFVTMPNAISGRNVRAAADAIRHGVGMGEPFGGTLGRLLDMPVVVRPTARRARPVRRTGPLVGRRAQHAGALRVARLQRRVDRRAARRGPRPAPAVFVLTTPPLRFAERTPTPRADLYAFRLAERVAAQMAKPDTLFRHITP